MVERPAHDELAPKEAEAAAREAARIDGPGAEDDIPEEQRPVVEGGGDEAEGFEQAEEELVEVASHGDPAPDPTELVGEPEDDRADPDYGEPDRIESTERTDEREEGRG
jgi:hypothetical protein